jgi:hypothetical protein
VDKNHNGGPPPINLTPSTKLECIQSVLDRGDLTAAQKCVGVGLIVAADKEWVSEVGTEDLKRMASIKDRETVFNATKRLDDLGVVSKQSKRGQAGRFSILPPRIVTAVIAAYEETKSGRTKPDQSIRKQSGETGRGKQSAPTTFPVGSVPTSGEEVVGSVPTSRVEPDHSRARDIEIYNNNIYNNLSPPLPPKPQADAPREGEVHIGHGVFLNCTTIRHKNFTLSIEGVTMQIASSPACEPTIDATRAKCRDICQANALQWAAEIENGADPKTVVPTKPLNFIVQSIVNGSVRTEAVRNARSYNKPPLETPEQRKRRLMAEAADELRGRK